MNSWLGWTTISQAELAAAQQAAQLLGQGVRDEIGVSAIHFLYSERFFPGTSVQLTRLRYIFFVAALYEAFRWRPRPANLEETIAQAERRLGLQLIAYHEKYKIPLEGSGIIGRTIINSRPPVLLPSISYWTPIARWGLLATEEGSSQVPSRAAIHANWDTFRRGKGHRGEVDTRSALFTFELESRWVDGAKEYRRIGDGHTPVSFDLTSWERSFLQQRLSSLEQDHSQCRALIAHLADAELEKVIQADHPWSHRVLSVLPSRHPDLQLMDRARRAAHLVQIARAIYDVLVAKLIRDRDGLPKGRHWTTAAEEHLQSIASPHSISYQLATSLSIDAVQKDAERVDSRFDDGLGLLLRKTQEWLAGATHDPNTLAQILREREIAKKGKVRARLVPDARERRKDWTFSPAQPLEYRWSVVTRLLSDLAGVK